MFGEHLKEVRDLMDLKRYQNKFRHKQRSVAEHSWFVAKVAHGLALWEKNKFGTEGVDIEKVLFLALNHDIVEGYTGDILSTTKKLSPVLLEELEKVEGLIFKNHIVGTLPQSWGSMYLDLHKEMTERTTINSKIVKAADLIDRVFECAEEIALQNVDPFRGILIKDIKMLHELHLMSASYFMKYSMKDINLYEYISEDIKADLDVIDFKPYF